MSIHNYISTLNDKRMTGLATEHTYRAALGGLIEKLFSNILATNEPRRQACGAPDYILTLKDSQIPVCYIETKDIGNNDLDGIKKSGNKEQFDRYKSSLGNLIFTDYLNFHFYRGKEFKAKITIGEVSDNGITPLPESFDRFTYLLKDSISNTSQNITSSRQLAQMMAEKARLLANIIANAIIIDNNNAENTTLTDQLDSFRQILIHDITAHEFADIYAQTIAYGMFAARYHDPTLPTFSREEAYQLIPKSNPFLKKLFGYIASLDVDDRIKWIVDDLIQIFLACNVEKMLKNYGKNTQTEDPIIHFYEDFLSEYDPELRKYRGVWYTPKPVVNFIVRSVDYILKKDFDAPNGLADDSKISITIDKAGKKVVQDVHRIQILDPATGTGTFLAEAILNIYRKFEKQKGIWTEYVPNDLLPRINGFELLMASYAMAHLKVDLLLTETGYKENLQRLRIYLTNSLEQYHPNVSGLFADWLSTEANEANRIKRDIPIMCIIGNPPYSGESANQNQWISALMEAYKKEPGGKEKLKEKNPKWINDDYVKFIRYAQHYVEKNGSGIIAFINPHGYLDNPTFRGMRWNLANTFDKIYIIDLHGNAKKKETAPDGGIDQNVFDIMQGVCINIFVKTGEKKKPGTLAKIFHHDLFGKREYKYDFLSQKNLTNIPFKEIQLKAPGYFMVPKNLDLENEYNQGFALNDLFPINSVGIVTARDGFTIHHTKNDLKKTIEEFLQLTDEAARTRFNLGKDVRDWQVGFAKKDLKEHYPQKGKIVPIAYRPFDTRWTFYTGKSKGFHCMPRNDVMKHFIVGDNVGLITIRRSRSSEGWREVFCTKQISAGATTISSLDINYVFPLYIYSKPDFVSTTTQNTRSPNLNMVIIQQTANNLGLTFTPEKEFAKNTFAPIDILDYIYAVLHSPNYREQYKEFLKIDFPRIPYPQYVTTFWQLANLGAQLRELHLLESPDLDENYSTEYPISGSNIIEKIEYFNHKVWINDSQYFDGVPESAWNFYIGGYQPAQKWLKDRKGSKLSHNDLFHYQKIIVSLIETEKIMHEISTLY